MSLAVEPSASERVLLTELESQLLEGALVTQVPFERDELVTPAAEISDALAAESGEVAHRCRSATHIVSCDEARPWPDHVGIDRDARVFGRRQLRQLRLFGHERGEDYPLGTVGAA